MERKKQIIESKFPPSNKEVIWLDSSKNTIKKYINGSWQSMMVSGGGSSDEPGGDTPSVPEEKLFTLKGLYSSYVDYISDCLILNPEWEDVDDWRPENLFRIGEYGEIGKFYDQVINGSKSLYIKIDKEGLDQVRHNDTAVNEYEGDEFSLQCFEYSNNTDLEYTFENSSDSILVELTKTSKVDHSMIEHQDVIAYEGTFTFKGITYSISIDAAYDFESWYYEFPIIDGGDLTNYFFSNEFRQLNLEIVEL